jgi:hypothetical protein
LPTSGTPAGGDAILQPSKPDVVPAARVMARYAAETSAGHAEAQLS